MMNTNFQMLRSLNKKYDSMEHKRGFLTGEEVNLIEEELHIKEMDILALRNLRDFAVMYLSKVKREDDMESRLKACDKVSAITAVIDNRIFSLGGEV